jgi:hypothetical protein
MLYRVRQASFLFPSDRSVQKRKFACRTLYNLINVKLRVRSSETSVNLYRTPQRCIPEDTSLHSHRSSEPQMGLNQRRWKFASWYSQILFRSSQSDIFRTLYCKMNTHSMDFSEEANLSYKRFMHSYTKYTTYSFWYKRRHAFIYEIYNVEILIKIRDAFVYYMCNV